MKGMRIVHRREWELGDQIDGCGFGQAFAATAGDEKAVVKLVPKESGADRELLFTDLDMGTKPLPRAPRGWNASCATGMARVILGVRIAIGGAVLGGAGASDGFIAGIGTVLGLGSC